MSITIENILESELFNEEDIGGYPYSPIEISAFEELLLAIGGRNSSPDSLLPYGQRTVLVETLMSIYFAKYGESSGSHNAADMATFTDAGYRFLGCIHIPYTKNHQMGLTDRSIFDSNTERWVGNVVCGHCKGIELETPSGAVINAYKSSYVLEEVKTVLQIVLTSRFPTDSMIY